eukprot:Opistho-1_new@59924
MLVKDFLTLYREDGFVQMIAEQIKTPKDYPHIQIKGFIGSLDAVVASALHLLDEKQSHLFVLSDREEAAYFINDLQNLVGEERVLSFPMSYKRAYQYEEVDNAHVLCVD